MMFVCFDILFHGVLGHGVLSVCLWLRAFMLGYFRELDLLFFFLIVISRGRNFVQWYR